jgi:hypothetical protein
MAKSFIAAVLGMTRNRCGALLGRLEDGSSNGRRHDAAR